MGDIDLDAFTFGDEFDLDPPRPAPPASDAIRPEVARAAMTGGGSPDQLPPEPMQMTMEGGEVPHVKNVTPARTRLRGLIYVSQPDGDGEGHIVVLHDTPEGPAALCNCKATRNLNRRPQGCWATIDARAIFGLPAVGEA